LVELVECSSLSQTTFNKEIYKRSRGIYYKTLRIRNVQIP
jgi:hypothetical protein